MHQSLVSSLTALVVLAGLASAQTTYFVSTTGLDTNPGTSALPFLTISKGISVAASGDAIRVAAGTYGLAEQIEFTGPKNLTLVGNGIGSTIIRGHASLVQNFLSGPLPGVLETHRCGITVSGPGRIEMRNFTVDMAFNLAGLSPNGRLYGIFVHNGGDALIDNVEVTNTRRNPLGSENAGGIVVRGDLAADECKVWARQCYIHDFSKAGFVSFFNSDVIVDECHVVGAGPTNAIAQNAIQVSQGGMGFLRGNVVKDCFYNPVSNTGAGILLFDQSAGTVLEANKVNRCQGGILCFRSVPSLTPTSIRNNKVTESVYGIELSFCTGTTVSDNVIQGATFETAFDDTAGNTWIGNDFSDWGGVGGYTIFPILAIDPSPRKGYDGLGAGVAIPVGGVPVKVAVANLGGSAALDFATVNEPANLAVQPTLSVGIAGAFPAYAVTNLAFGGPGEIPSAIATGEFNGAAGVDLVVTTSSTSKYYVFANNGSGVFSLLTSATLPATALVPNDVAAGDLNGDARADLVIVTLGSVPLTPGGAFAFINNGTGTAFTAITLPGAFAGQCKGVALGRLDAGATLDIAVTEGTGAFGRVHIYFNTGAGNPAAFGFAIAPTAVDVDPTSVTIFDFNADGVNDVAVSCTNNSVPLTPGSATFLITNGVPLVYTPTVHRTGNGPQSIQAGDLNANADPDTQRRDAVTCNFASGTLSLISSFQRGGFAANYVGLAGTTPRACALAAMDGDALLDIVVADAATSTVRIALGVPTALGDYYGAGCANNAGNGARPLITTSGVPGVAKQPNLTFGVGLDNARGLTAAVLVASATSAGVAPCSFLLGSADVTWVAFTNALGSANVFIPVPPPLPSLAGVVVFFQWGVFDPTGAFPIAGGGITLSQGLRLRVGA